MIDSLWWAVMFINNALYGYIKQILYEVSAKIFQDWAAEKYKMDSLRKISES